MLRVREPRMLILLVALAAVGCSQAAETPNGLARVDTATQCGFERWPVKTLTDLRAGQVNLAPKSATVEELAALPVPDGFGRDAERLEPEFQTYTVVATLVEFRQETDSDIHLVIVGESGQSMIAEIPDPTCVEGSRAQAQIARARARFVELFGQPSPTWHEANASVTVTGVLFFDVHHGQTGVAPNAVELHPVIGMGP